MSFEKYSKTNKNKTQPLFVFSYRKGSHCTVEHFLFSSFFFTILSCFFVDVDLNKLRLFVDPLCTLHFIYSAASYPAGDIVLEMIDFSVLAPLLLSSKYGKSS